MRRDYKLYLQDILEAIQKIQSYTSNISFEAFLKDSMRIDAVIRNLEIIGEASGRISDEIKERYPQVEWRKISNFRNMLAHEYFGIDYEILWDIIQNKLPRLKSEIK